MDIPGDSGKSFFPFELHDICTSLEEGVLVMDEGWKVLYVNHSLETMFRLEPNQATGKTLEASLGGKADPTLIKSVVSILTTTGHWQGALSFNLQDGSAIHVSLRINRINSRHGVKEFNGYVAVIRDVSAEHELESQLRHAQKMEAIGTLAGGIAHDFNNILSAIMGFAELAALDAPPDSEQAENIGEILIAGRRARDLVKQILAFSRQSVSTPQPFIMKPIISEALKMLRSSLPKTIEIKRDIYTTGPIIGDPVEIHQVLMNLCTNAAMAMEEKGGILAVSLSEVEVNLQKASKVRGLRPGPHVLLSVGDNGVGMSQETLQRIFEPFFTTRPDGSCQGLGLSVVHGIVTQSGGAIEVESEVGKGSTFNLYWPMVCEKREEVPPATGPLPAGSEHILFVDDEDFQVSLAQKMLGSLGYKVSAFTSPILALEAFAKAPETYHLLVTDITMPELTGIELSEKVRELNPGLPIIMCTGYSHIIQDDTATRYGVDALVGKPVVMKEIAATIRHVLEGKGSPRAG